MQIFGVEGGEGFASSELEVVIEAPSVTEKSIIVLTQSANGGGAFRNFRVKSITPSKSFVVEISSPGKESEKAAFYWAVLN